MSIKVSLNITVLKNIFVTLFTNTKGTPTGRSLQIQTIALNKGKID